jgi:hypothetical protein
MTQREDKWKELVAVDNLKVTPVHFKNGEFV